MAARTDSTRAMVLSAVLLSAFASAMLLIAPLIVGALITLYGFSPQQAGLTISIELGAMSLAGLPALAWMPRLPWRPFITGALLLLVAGNVACAFAHSFAELASLRFLTGLGGGTLMVVAMAAIERTPNTERNFGWWTVGQLIVGAVGLTVLPRVMPALGLRGLFFALAALFALGLLAVRTMPHGADATVSGARPTAAAPWRVLLALAGILLFYVALSGVWTFMERIGAAAAIQAKTIGNDLTLASLCGIAGCLSATWLGARVGRIGPLVGGLALLVGSITLLLGELSQAQFLIASCGFKFAWTFVLPFMLAGTASLDTSGRILALANLMIGCGLALGPAIVAAALGTPANYSVALWVGVAGGLLSLTLLLFSLRAQHRI